MVKQKSQRLANGLSLLAFIIAFGATAVLMIGDQLGRVNLLYILLLFVFIPLLTLITALLVAVFKAPLNFASVLLNFPLWPRSWLASQGELKRSKLHRPWLFLQSQKIALVLSLGSLLAFFVLLLISDVVFVWRSTLLNVDHIYPILKTIAQPWYWVELAQPLKEQVASAQDSRLLLNVDLLAADIWWRYIFMAQLCYVLIPRLCMYYWGHYQFKKATLRQAQEKINQQSEQGVALTSNHETPLQAIGEDVLDLSQGILLQWVGLPIALQQKLFDKLGVPQAIYSIEGKTDQREIDAVLLDRRHKTILVAAWEPPLGELEDFMRQTTGTLLLLDWVGDHFQRVESQHLDEWRRFCCALSNWQLVQCEELV